MCKIRNVIDFLLEVEDGDEEAEEQRHQAHAEHRRHADEEAWHQELSLAFGKKEEITRYLKNTLSGLGLSEGYGTRAMPLPDKIICMTNVEDFF